MGSHSSHAQNPAYIQDEDIYSVLELKSTFDLLLQHEITDWLQQQIPLRCNASYTSHGWEERGWNIDDFATKNILWHLSGKNINQNVKIWLTKAQSKAYAILLNDCPLWYRTRISQADRYDVFLVIKKFLHEPLACLVIEYLKSV